MQVAVVGTGNVGSALLFHLIDVSSIDEILVMNLKDEWSSAAIMDAASAKPEAALKLSVAPFTRIHEADVLLLTSGVQMKEGETGQDVLERNIEVMNTILDSAAIKKSAVLIGLATPVDDITTHIQKRYDLPSNQVFGFGGDLDRNRLTYVLRTRNNPVQEVWVVGEHGKNTVPVYRGEKEYEEVAQKTRNFLGDITAHGGSPRNLATGLLLARIAESVITDAKRVHCVCGYHPQYKCYLTWPFTIGREGTLDPEPLTLPPKAESGLRALLYRKGTKISL
jgi:L-lactate dehydrogenase